MDIQTVILSHISSKSKKTPSGWIAVNCPMCTTQGHARNDTRMRGGFKVGEVISYHCFNCNFKSSFTKGRLINKRMRELMLAIGVPEQKIKELQFQAIKEQSNDSQTGGLSKWTLDFKEIKLPNDAMPIEQVIKQSNPPSDAVFVYKYIMDRGLDFHKNFYWSPDPYMKINQRLLVPFYYNSKVVGYTGRLIKDVENVPKYYSSVQPNYLYNVDKLFEDRVYTVIVEGVLDALAINGISSLGNKLTQAQIDLINSVKSQVIVCPDRDKSGGNLVDIATENNWKVSYPEWESGVKDTAEAVQKYGRLYTLQTIIKSATNNNAKIQVLKKIGVN